LRIHGIRPLGVTGIAHFIRTDSLSEDEYSFQPMEYAPQRDVGLFLQD